MVVRLSSPVVSNGECVCVCVCFTQMGHRNVHIVYGIYVVYLIIFVLLRCL